jgi:hypothetical protein
MTCFAKHALIKDLPSARHAPDKDLPKAKLCFQESETREARFMIRFTKHDFGFAEITTSGQNSDDVWAKPTSYFYKMNSLKLLILFVKSQFLQKQKS